jgi:hypothetical protein
LLTEEGKMQLARATQQQTEQYRQSELGIRRDQLEETKARDRALYGIGEPGGGAQSGNTGAMVDLIGQYKAAPPSTAQMYSRNPAVARQAQALMEQVMTKYPDYDSTQWFGRKAAETSAIAAGPRADAQALTQLTKQQAAVNSFENTAIKNGRTLLQLAQKVDSTGMPVVERWLRAGKQRIAGDTDVNDFMAQLQIYRNEVAKITTNPNLTGVLTVEAQKEAAGFLGGNISYPQLQTLIPLLEKDFKNRSSSISEEIDTVKNRLKGGGGSRSSQQPAAGGGGDAPPVSMLQEGHITTFKNGQKWMLENGQPKQVQ